MTGTRFQCTGILFVLVTAISGCATTPHYEPSSDGAFAPGYSEIRIGEGNYRLRFNGYRHDAMENVLALWHKRATELCGDNNYSASPETLVNDSVLMMYPGTKHPEEKAYPYVEGEVRCKDPQLAHRVGPAQYNPGAGFAQLSLKSVSRKHPVQDDTLPVNFNHYMRDQLKRYGAGSAARGKYEMNVVIDRFIGDQYLLSTLSGMMPEVIYLMESSVTVLDTETGQVLGEKRITTRVGFRGVAESRLKNEHARDIVEYAVSMFPRKQKAPG